MAAERLGGQPFGGRVGEAVRSLLTKKEKHAIREVIIGGDFTVKEMDYRDRPQVQTYVNFLNDPRNRLHFANPPKDVKELRDQAKPGTYFLVATKLEKDNQGKPKEVVVGGAVIEDKLPPQNDHFIGLVVVDPDRQKQGIGEKLMIGVIEWGFRNRTHQKNKRTQLHLGITTGIEGWEIMQRLVQKKLGFKWVNTIEEEVDFWEVHKPDQEPKLLPGVIELKTDFVKKFDSDNGIYTIERPDGTVVNEPENLERYNYRVEKEDGTVEVYSPDGTSYSLVKKTSKRYKLKHSTWEQAKKDRKIKLTLEV